MIYLLCFFYANFLPDSVFKKKITRLFSDCFKISQNDVDDDHNEIRRVVWMKGTLEYGEGGRERESLSSNEKI